MQFARRKWLETVGILLGAALVQPAIGQEAAKETKPASKEGEGEKWTPLFNGKDLTGWKKSGFAGEGEPEVKEGVLVLPTGGGRITGLTYTKEFPKTDFEIHLEARRVDGTDFFCALTFPVGDSHASLICGGWGGSVTGISSINGYDASENSSSKYVKYENGKWYDIKLKVTDASIQAWIDGKQQVDVEREGTKFSLRIESEVSKPLGIAAFETKAEYRKFEWRPVKADAAK